MNDPNRYAPPRAKLEDARRPPLSAIKAMLLGLAIDIGGTFVTTLVIALLFTIGLASLGRSEGEITAALTDAPAGSPFWLLSMAAGLGCSVLGGYVCTHRAQRSDYRLGALLGMLSVLSGLMMMGERAAEPQSVYGSVAGFAAVMAGTWLAIQRRKR